MQFLTEERLKNLTKVVFRPHEILFNYRIAAGKFIPDIFIPEKRLIIEFDGFRHFSEARTVLRDIKLDNYAGENNIDIVHVPYFVQVDSRTFPLIFKTALTPNVEELLSDFMYPHGFIDNKAMLPSNYCYIGLQRFIKVLDYFSCVRSEVFDSLHPWVSAKGKHPYEVYPPDFVLNRYIVLYRDTSESGEGVLMTRTAANCKVNAALHAVLGEESENDKELEDKTAELLDNNLVDLGGGLYFTSLDENMHAKNDTEIHIIDLYQLEKDLPF